MASQQRCAASRARRYAGNRSPWTLSSHCRPHLEIWRERRWYQTVSMTQVVSDNGKLAYPLTTRIIVWLVDVPNCRPAKRAGARGISPKATRTYENPVLIMSG